jgi:hypothetical protein
MNRLMAFLSNQKSLKVLAFRVVDFTAEAA